MIQMAHTVNYIYFTIWNYIYIHVHDGAGGAI